MSSIEKRTDAWVNVTTGIGGSKDKSSGYRFASNGLGDAWYAFEELYEEDHVAGKIVDALPDAVFADGIIVEIADQQQKELTLDKLDKLEAEDSVSQAMKWERLHGGAAIFLGVDDGGRRFDEPLVEANVRQVLYLHVFDRWELYPARFYEDPKSPKFGKPSHYRVSPSDATMGRHVYVVVHETRLILFRGQQTTKRKLIENQYWGQSVLVRSYTPIKQYGGSLAAVLALASDASQGVYKIKNLLQIIEGGNEAALVARFQSIDKLRSILNAVLLDADGEDYAKVATQLTELANIVDRFMMNTAAAADMPVTEAFGISAAGLNATGENDTRSWYKKISRARRKSAKPAVERILRLVFRSSDGPTKGQEPTSWSVKFPPAWSPTALEQEQIKKTKTERAVLLKDLGVVNEHQIARGLLSGSEWDGDIVLTAEEIDALRILAGLAGMPAHPPSSATPTDDVPNDVDPQLTQDDQGEELAKLNPVKLAEQMTAHGLKRCEHGKKERCRLCGIERSHDLIGVDANGDGIWDTKWRAIGARTPAATEPDPSAADE